MPQFASFPWRRQSSQPSDRIEEACRQYHHAAQFLAAAGQSLLPHQPDDSHTTLDWLPQRQAFAGHWIADRYRLVLDYPTFSLRWEERGGHPHGACRLDGKTPSAIFDWLRREGMKFLAEAADIQPIDHFSLPDHPLQEPDTAFRAPAPALRATLAGYRTNAHHFLRAIADMYLDQAAPVRTWPHHFDTATLLRLARNSEGEMTKSIGLGLAIPDGLTDGFYYYISPWQSSGEVDIRDLHPLPAGEWRTGDWTGAILPLSTLAERSSSGEQKELLGAFADQALATWIERLQG